MRMDFIHLAQFLTKLPDRDSYEHMFRSIDSIQMCIDKKKFTSVLAYRKDNRDVTWYRHGGRIVGHVSVIPMQEYSEVGLRTEGA